ncbi:hypothetical protein [Bergeyella sp. RCAD1439]|uniref:hypothetical protein n=1 Tax=Bergeyella anatis TaxID=3113737 RepID=UPI002E184A06|nr:hypothetical protein [Bergeyella sp. RCAD1439]
MKIKLLFPLALGLLLTACKEETNKNTQNKDSFSLSASDTAAVASDSLSTNPTGTPKPLNQKAAPGQIVFQQNGKVLIAFDHQAQSGTVVIGETTYHLNRLNFTENNYELFGEKIRISAENGSFQDPQGECLHGVFPKVTIEFSGQTSVLSNINVQDCPVY